MFSPKGSVHQFSNPHKETVRALTIMTPDLVWQRPEPGQDGSSTLTA